ncbi:MAG: hypothetical protein ACK4IT_06785 [Thioalkalivibrionaceae bacterium]
MSLAIGIGSSHGAQAAAQVLHSSKTDRVTAQSTNPIPAYTARYRAQAYGNELIATTELRYTGDRAIFRFNAEVQGFLRALGRFAFERESEVALDPHHYRLIRSHARQETPRRTRTADAVITPTDVTTHDSESQPIDPSQTTLTATGTVNEREFTLTTTGPVDDFLSSLLNAMRDTARHRPTDSSDASYNDRSRSDTVVLLERGEFRHYQLEYTGHETLNVQSLGEISAQRIDRFDEAGELVFSAWLAIDHYGIPVRFDYIDDRRYRLELQSVTFATPPSAETR